MNGKQVQVVAHSELKTYADDEDGLIKADQALQELGPDSEKTSEVVFGFDPLWVNNDGLLNERKPFIKNLTTSLGLKPVGFVVITDALVQQLLVKDSLASEVLVYVQEDTVFISLIKQGKLVHQLSVGRSEDIIQDIVEGLARFQTELKGKDNYLPAKLVLASAVLSPSALEDAQQQISTYAWSESHPFVQPPLVENLSAIEVLDAVATQGGLAVAQETGLGQTESEGRNTQAESEKTPEAEAADFGFASVESPVAEGDNFTEPPSQQRAKATSFGVPISTADLPEVVEKSPMSSASAVSTKKRWRLPKVFSQVYQWYLHHPHRKMILAGAAAGALALLLVLVIWTRATYRVEATIQLAEKVITKDVTITIDPAIAASNVERQILKGTLETIEMSGSETVDTTGSKLVGEQAKGTATIFNKTTSPKTFTAGTRLSAGALTFLLDEDITIASASVEENEGGTGETKNYGQVDAKLTASAIGADSNLGKDTEMTVASFDAGTYSATVKDAFTGGSSREVRVVDQTDREAAMETLTEKLLADAAKQFEEKSGNGTYYVSTRTFDVVEATFDAATSEEADRLTLNLKLDVDGVKYQSGDMQPLLEAALQPDIPEGYQLVGGIPEFLSSAREEATASARVTLDTNVTAKAQPPFNETNVKSDLVNLPLGELNAKLAERFEIEQASYNLKPGIARWFVTKTPGTVERILFKITNQVQ